MITIRQAKSTNEVSAAIDIQLRVFAEEQGIPEDDCQSGNDEALHLLAYDDAAIVATGRLRLMEDRIAEIARIAVLPEYRSAGLGKKLVGKLESMAAISGATELVLYPHAFLETFYSSLGYTKTDEHRSAVGEHEIITMRKPVAGPDSHDEKKA